MMSTRKPYECNHCNKRFTTREGSEKHTIAVHGYECSYCLKLFNKAESVEQHSKAVHGQGTNKRKGKILYLFFYLRKNRQEIRKIHINT